MRYAASEKLEIIRIVEGAHLSTRQTLAKLGIPRTTFYEQTLQTRGTSPLALSDYIGVVLEGIKYINNTREQMLTAMATLRATLLAIVEEG